MSTRTAAAFQFVISVAYKNYTHYTHIHKKINRLMQRLQNEHKGCWIDHIKF